MPGEAARAEPLLPEAGGPGPQTGEASGWAPAILSAALPLPLGPRPRPVRSAPPAPTPVWSRPALPAILTPSPDPFQAQLWTAGRAGGACEHPGGPWLRPVARPPGSAAPLSARSCGPGRPEALDQRRGVLSLSPSPAGDSPFRCCSRPRPATGVLKGATGLELAPGVARGPVPEGGGSARSLGDASSASVGGVEASAQVWKDQGGPAGGQR